MCGLGPGFLEQRRTAAHRRHWVFHFIFKLARVSSLTDCINLVGINLTEGSALCCSRQRLFKIVSRDEVINCRLFRTTIEVLYPMHHGYEPFSAPHPEINSIGDGPLLETISHIPYVLLFNVVEVIEAVEACFSGNVCPLIRDPKVNPIEALVDKNIWVDHSCHVVNIVSCL